MEIPDFLPVLDQGSHRHPREGACLMEYASILAGEPFDDHPASVHLLLRGISVSVNDNSPDGDRNRLALLLPRLIGTGAAWEPSGGVGELAEFLWRYVGHPATVSRWFDVPGREAASIAVSYARRGAHYQALSMAGRAAAEQGAGYMYLEHCLDAFDRATGRKERPKPFTEQQYRELASKVGAAA